MPEETDLVIIGGGVAGTSVMQELLGEDRMRGRSIVIIERSEDLYRGLPYGERSGSASLIVTPLRDFLEDDLRAEFRAWLDAHRAQILQGWPDISVSWVREHEQEIRDGSWEELFVPRRLFGDFQAERMRAAIARSCIPVREIRGEALSVQEAPDRALVRVQTADGPLELAARCVVLALGSPPKQLLPRTERPGGCGRIVEDTHAHGMDGMLRELSEDLRELPAGASRSVLVVGANADALELLHAMHRAPLPHDWQGRVRVIAPRGAPDAWTLRPDRRAEFSPVHLAAYARSTPDDALTARAVHDAIARDVERAIADGLGEQDAVDELKALMGQLLDRMPRDEQQRFVDEYGNLINRFYRPTGGDYQRVASDLLAAGALPMIRGRFVEAEQSPEGWAVRIGTEEGPQVLAERFGVIVNCTGFQDLRAVGDPLLRSLGQDGPVQLTPNRRGIAVDRTFRASPHVLVAGPLLAGNLNERLRVWHLESCRRILELAPEIAEQVLAELGAA